MSISPVLATTRQSKKQSSIDYLWWLAGGIDPDDVVATYWPKGAANYKASKVDVSGNGNDAYEGVAPGWTAADGWVFDGTQWLDSGVTPLSNTYSIIVRFSNFVAAGDYDTLFGAYKTSYEGSFLLVPDYLQGDNLRALYGPSHPSGSRITSSPAFLGGVFAMTGTGGGIYRDGILDELWSSELMATNCTIYIGAQHTCSGVADNISKVHIQAISIYSTTITSSQVAALTTAMQAL